MVPMFAQGLIYAPNIAWADDLVIAEMSQFPYGRRDDLTDLLPRPWAFCGGVDGCGLMPR